MSDPAGAGPAAAPAGVGCGPRVLAIDTPAHFARAVEEAAAVLSRGDLVAVPTETVYGLAANALDARAVLKIYEAKGRPAFNPLIVHVAGMAMARSLAAFWSERAERFARAFWPGPLTLVVPAAAGVPREVTAGGDTVGIRWPLHPFMRAVIAACGFPLAAPSANPSNALSPTDAAHVVAGLGPRIGLVIDGGACSVGIESTVLDVAADPPRVLRPGMIDLAALRAVDPAVVDRHVGEGSGGGSCSALRSPGQLERHYSPRARLVTASWRDGAGFEGVLERLGAGRSAVWVLAHTVIPSSPAGLGGVVVVPHDPEAYARALYAELHRCDAAGAGWILVEAVPAGGMWEGVADRLRRAGAEPGRAA